MVSKTSFLQFLLLASATASPLSLKLPRTERVKWGECDKTFNGTLPITCGNITVPLDYTSPNSTETLDIGLLKVPAKHQPSRGSILFNFGGPGVPVRGTLAARAIWLQAITGGHHDLIGWDPRGTGQTMTFSCFESPEARIYDALSKATFSGNSSDTALGRSWASATLTARTCAAYPDAQKKGNFIGTAFVARDMVQIVDALDDDKLLRYWGFSYGTVLGSTFAAMFPDKVDKIVIDGVYNPTEYWHAAGDVEPWSDTDAVFSQFFEQCVSHPAECALARPNSTAASLEAATWDLIDTTKYRPIASIKGYIFDYTKLKQDARSALYAPNRWQTFSRYLNGLLTGNLTEFEEAFGDLGKLTPPVLAGGTGDDSPFGIHCADKIPRTTDYDEMVPVIKTIQKTSRLQGDQTNMFTQSCVQWPYESAERYLDGFQGIKTKNPVLVIGNTWDPATPLRSAKNITEGIEGSVLLQQNSFGHCTSQQPSVCTAKVVQNYFVNGVLPEPNTVCEPNYHPFSKTQLWDELLPEIKAE